MHQSSLQTCEQCVNLLAQPSKKFKKVEYLKKLTKISNNQKYRKTCLFLYCLYCILHKYDYVEALQTIEKSEGVDKGSMLSMAIGKLIRALLYTYIDKHRDSISLMKQASSLMKSTDSISLEMKNHYKRMIPLIISNLNISNGKKSFYKIFNQIYDELAKQSTQNALNEQILYSIHTQIQFLKTQIDILPTLLVSTNTSKAQQNTIQKSLSGTKLNTKSNSIHQHQEEDYIGFSKPLTKEEKSVNNIKKMIQSRKQMKQTLQHSKSTDFLEKGVTAFGKKSYIKNSLKNQPNPYQLNFYAEEKPQCEFL